MSDESARSDGWRPEWAEQVEFDLDRITTEMWISHVEALNGPDGDDAWCQFFAKVIKALPKGWGKPGIPATYRGLSQFEQWEPLREVFDAFLRERRSKPPDIAGVVFDLSGITVADWRAHREAIALVPGNAPRAIIEHWWTFFPRVVTALPDGWGDPQDPATYPALRHFAQLDPLITLFHQAVEDTRKKARPKPT